MAIPQYIRKSGCGLARSTQYIREFEVQPGLGGGLGQVHQGTWPIPYQGQIQLTQEDKLLPYAKHDV